MAEIHVNMKQLNKWKVYSDNVIAYDQIIQSKGKFFTDRPEIYTRWLDEYGIFYTLKGAEKEIRKANPAPRKRAAKKSGAEADYETFAASVKKNLAKRAPSARVGKTRKQYVSRPSQAPGHKAPSKRLQARRKKALNAPQGYFPNPDKSRQLATATVEIDRGKGWEIYEIIQAPGKINAGKMAIFNARHTAKLHPDWCIRVLTK